VQLSRVLAALGIVSVIAEADVGAVDGDDLEDVGGEDVAVGKVAEMGVLPSHQTVLPYGVWTFAVATGVRS
jgi:hypothetical protein